MASTENDASAPRPDALAEWTGYLLTAPLVLCLAGVGLLPAYTAQELAQRAAIAWGAALLAFTAAVHFGLALAGQLPWTRTRAALAGAATLTAAAAVVVGGQHGLAVLVVGFGAFWLYEHRVLGATLPARYLSLRRHLTLTICVLLAVTMAVSDTAGLS